MATTFVLLVPVPIYVGMYKRPSFSDTQVFPNVVNPVIVVSVPLVVYVKYAE